MSINSQVLNQVVITDMRYEGIILCLFHKTESPTAQAGLEFLVFLFLLVIKYPDKHH